MEDYNFMLSEEGLHKTRFCKNRGGGGGGGGLTKTFLIKGGGVGAKGGGGLERFCILKWVWPVIKVIFIEIFLLKLVRIIWKCCIEILAKFVANDKVT